MEMLKNVSEASGYQAVTDAVQGRVYQLDQREVVRVGRNRELWRSIGIVVALLVAQQPMRLVVTSGMLEPAETYARYAIPAEVPVRMSLLLDGFLIVAYVLLAYRAFCRVRFERPGSRWVGVSLVGFGIVLLAAALDVAEDVVLWNRGGTGEHPLEVFVGGASSTAVLLVLVLLGLALALVVPRIALRVRDKAPARGAAPRLQQPPAAAPGTIICCSGGGIRASAFSLGGLQVLAETTDPGTKTSVYDGASAVVGVSGGGYVAAAFHTLRWKSGSPADEHQDTTEAAAAAADLSVQLAAVPPFSGASPELQWFRRHTRYVLDSGRAAVDAVLSVAFGIAVNLVLLFTVIGGLAWLMSWIYLASGKMVPTADGDEARRSLDSWFGGYAGDWTWADWLWVVPVLGVLAFVLMKVVDYLGTLNRKWRARLSDWSVRLLVIGVALIVLLQGIPWLLEHLQRWAASSGSPPADLLYRLGLVPGSLCQDALAEVPRHAACGVSLPTDLDGAVSRTWTTTGGVTAIVTSLVAVLGSLRGGSKEGAAGSAQGLGQTLGAVWAKVKVSVVPWTALAAIVLTIVVVLLRWIVGLTNSGPQHGGVPNLALWSQVLVAGILLLGIRVLTEPNRTSLHHFFRERISYAFLLRRTPEGGVEPVQYSAPLRFSESAGVEGPALVTCAVANVTDADLVPSRRGCTPFVFDARQIGLTDALLPDGASRRASAAYEFAADYRYRDATVPAAVAMSAAAFSPLAGRENALLGPYRVALALANARLGVWLPNPVWLDEVQLGRRLLRLREIREADALVRRMSVEDRLLLRSTTSLWSRTRKRPFDLAVIATVLLTAEGDLLDEAEALSAACRSAGRDSWAGDIEAARQRPSGPDRVAAIRDAAATIRSTALSGDGRGWHWLAYLGGMLAKPGITRVAKEAVGKASAYDRFLYVTDGGHYDNLGLLEALRQRPQEVIVIDASNDPENVFRTLGRAIATAQMDLNCEITLNPRPMKSTAGGPSTGRAPRAWIEGEARFKGGTGPQHVTKVWVAKALLFGELPWDVETYAADNTDFPRTSTANQLYGEFDFEAYRILGRKAMEGLLTERNARLPGTPPPPAPSS